MTRGIEARPSEWSWNFVNAGYIENKERERVVQDTLSTAYFFVLTQTHSLSQWEDLKRDPSRQIGWDNERAAIEDFSSHFNLVYNYMGDCIVGGPKTLPDNPTHKELFQTTKDAFIKLDRKKLRFIFAGEKGLDTEDPESRISKEELQSWLEGHSSKPDGLIQTNTPEKTTAIKDSMDLVRFLNSAEISDKNGEWIRQWHLATFSRFPEETLQLGVYKLACGMAVIDQLAREGANLGHPLQTSYIPSNRGDAEEYYGKLPTLQELWGKAHSLLRDLADPQDELLQHLFTLEKLENLKTDLTS